MNCLKVPEEMDDEHAILLSDILPTAWHANELARVEKGDNVAIWGCGPGIAQTSLSYNIHPEKGFCFDFWV